MKFCDTVVRFAIFPFFLPSPQTVSDGAVCLCKFHWLMHNVLIINMDKFLQQRTLSGQTGADRQRQLGFSGRSSRLYFKWRRISRLFPSWRLIVASMVFPNGLYTATNHQRVPSLQCASTNSVLKTHSILQKSHWQFYRLRSQKVEKLYLFTTCSQLLYK